MNRLQTDGLIPNMKMFCFINILAASPLASRSFAPRGLYKRFYLDLKRKRNFLLGWGGIFLKGG